jgi:hypothetical protein
LEAHIKLEPSGVPNHVMYISVANHQLADIYVNVLDTRVEYRQIAKAMPQFESLQAVFGDRANLQLVWSTQISWSFINMHMSSFKGDTNVY